MANKLDKINSDLKKARAKRDEWDTRVKELEKKYKETENTLIHEMVHAANLTPEQLALFIQKASVSVPEELPNEYNTNEEDNLDEE